MTDLNAFLTKVEKYLADLNITDRAKILSEIITEYSALEELPPALEIANKLRSKYELSPYKQKSPLSFWKIFWAFWLAMFLLFVGTISFVFYKFTPLLKIDEESNRVVILGGLIDIDGKAGRVKFFDKYHFADAKFKNDFQGSILLDEAKDEIILKFNSGAFTIYTSENSELKFDCKLEKAPDSDPITQAKSDILIDLTEMTGSSCDLHIPTDKKITMEGSDASISLKNPEFSAYIEITNGNVEVVPEPEVDYKYDLKVEEGYIGDFPSSDSDDAYEIQVQIKNGSVVTQ